MRVVPNLYPAFERQEVVIHSPRHVRSFAELDDEELAAVAQAWTRAGRPRAPRASATSTCVVNEGRAAGASLPHSHSQLVWLREPPPAVVDEAPHLQKGAAAPAPSWSERASLEIAVRGDIALLAAPGGRAPYELLILAASHEAEPTEQDLAVRGRAPTACDPQAARR